ncbi:Thymidylate kinase [Kluyvera cryocrescens]|uniref:Thymidylate kinase n=1 Tax=Kluyvera cryocrescens TaxID=580 RepID=A0A485C956_KLUCR|nr:Thymidylate kinase [Kluyvera cryocrescens]
MRSNYIVIEGLEGAGKTTARDVVVETLRETWRQRPAVLPANRAAPCWLKSCAVWCWILNRLAMK